MRSVAVDTMRASTTPVWKTEIARPAIRHTTQATELRLGRFYPFALVTISDRLVILTEAH
jgi:hypothetical protein